MTGWNETAPLVAAKFSKKRRESSPGAFSFCLVGIHIVLNGFRLVFAELLTAEDRPVSW
jgi:hypothetical protein